MRGLPPGRVWPGGGAAGGGAEHPRSHIAGELLSLSPYGVTALNHHRQHRLRFIVEKIRKFLKNNDFYGRAEPGSEAKRKRRPLCGESKWVLRGDTAGLSGAGKESLPGERELSSYFQKPVDNLFKERKGKLFEDSHHRLVDDIEKAAEGSLAGDQESVLCGGGGRGEGY